MATSEMKVTYDDIEIVYDEQENVWRFTLRGRDRSQRRIVTIKTNFVNPPIPMRQFDWSAYDSEKWDGDPEVKTSVGWGKTEQEAIADLLEQLGEL